MRKCLPAWPRSRSAIDEISVRWGNFQLIWIEHFCSWKLALCRDLVEIIFPSKRDNLLICTAVNADMKFYWYLCLHIMLKVSHYKTVYFLRYTHPRYMKCLFTNIQKRSNMLKSSLLLKKIQTLRVNNSRICRIKNAKFSDEPEYTVKFSNLH